MRRLAALALVLACSACTLPPGVQHYLTRDYDGTGRKDAYQFNEPGTDRTIWAVIFTDGHPELVDCTAVDC